MGKKKDLSAGSRASNSAVSCKRCENVGYVRKNEERVCDKGVLRESVCHRLKRAAVKKATDEQQTGIRSFWCRSALDPPEAC